MVARPSYKRIRKDYQSKNLSNPFFRKKVKPKSPRRRKILVLAYFLVIAGLVWFFFASPFWRIKKIEVSGLTRIGGVELEQIVWKEAGKRRGLVFHEDNIFLFKKNKAIAEILKVYSFAGADINKKWPDTLEVKVNERPYAFIFKEGSAYYYTSMDAYIIKEPAVSEEDKKKYFTLENKNAGTMISGNDKIDIKSDYLDFIFDLNSRLAAYPELPVDEYIIDHEFNTIKVQFVAGPIVFFRIQEDAGSQISRLILVKNEKIKDNFSKTNYIDLRYGDKIFINPDFN